MNLLKISILSLLITIPLGCSSLKSKISNNEKTYTIQKTEKLGNHFNKFIATYNTADINMGKFFSKDFVLESIRPVSHHREIDHVSEVKRRGLRKSLFGRNVRVIDMAMLKPWVLAHIEINIKGKVVEDLALIHINSKGIVQKIVHFWSKDHFETAYKTKIKTDSKKDVASSLEAIDRGYNRKDLRAAYSVLPDYIVFEKMNPYGVRNLSMPGQQRKDYLKEKLNTDELWDSKIRKLFIVPPYSIHHVIMEQNNVTLTERIVFRMYRNRKLVFTINFVGDEEHRIHLIENFYEENPVYKYDFK